MSPDGRRVAVVRTVQGNRDIWLLDGARASRFTFDPGSRPSSPSGRRTARGSCTRRRAGIGDSLSQAHERRGSGGAVPQSTDQILPPTSWSEDGRFLLYHSIDPKTNADLWVVPMSGNAEDRKPFVFLKTPFREAYGTFSPDGRWVAYHSNESGRPEVYVRPFVPPGATGTACHGGRRPVAGLHRRWNPCPCGGPTAKSCTTSTPTAR